MSEPKLCPYYVSALIPLLGKLSSDVSQGAMECLQDKCAMWREEKELVRRAYIVVHPDKPDERFPATHKTTGYCGLAGKP
jgi:hypothetical protein